MYLIAFGLTILCTYIAEKSFKKEKKIVGIFFSILAVLIPSILAGLRSRNIGTDIEVYIEPYFKKALVYKNFFRYYSSVKSDLLYLGVLYLVSRLTNNIQILFFVLELIIMIFLYLGIYNFRGKASMPLMMMVFLTFFYNRTLNLSRQSISIIIVFFAMKYVWERKLWKYIFFTIIAAGFHYSAVFTLVIYFLYGLTYKQGKTFLKIAIVVTIILVFANFQNFFIYLIRSGILPSKYTHYIEAQQGSFNFFETVFRVIIITMMGTTLEAFYKLDTNNKFLYFILILDVLIYQFGIISEYTQRISLYFGINTIYVLPQFVNSVKQETSNRKISVLLISSILITYWFINYVYLGIGETYPYEFFK